MAKPKKNTPATEPPTDAASTGPGPILDLNAIRALPREEQVGLYVQTEARQQAGFRLQGKILHTLGSEGTDLLRAAGIRPSSLSNARKAAWVLALFSDPAALPAPLNRIEFHTGAGEPVPFSEALYDTLTLRQCELVQIGLTSMGTYRHRPSQQTTVELLAREGWEDEIEHYLECGMTRAEKAEADAEAARQIEEERARQEQMRRQIEQQTAELERLRQQHAENPNHAPPAPPVVTFNTTPPPVAETEEDTETDTETETATPSNIIPMTTTTATAEPEPETETEPEVETPEQEQQEEEPEVTPEDIARAVADATAPIDLDQTLCVIEDDFASVVLTSLDVSDLQDIASRLEAVLSTVREAIAAKTTPQEELPAQPPKARRGKKALAPAA